MTWSAATLIVVVSVLGVTSCTGSDGTDDDSPTIGGINGPAVVDPSFDPFATDPSAPPATDGG
jgi:hypothetical protein